MRDPNARYRRHSHVRQGDKLKQFWLAGPLCEPFEIKSYITGTNTTELLTMLVCDWLKDWEALKEKRIVQDLIAAYLQRRKVQEEYLAMRLEEQAQERVQLSPYLE